MAATGTGNWKRKKNKIRQFLLVSFGLVIDFVVLSWLFLYLPYWSSRKQENEEAAITTLRVLSSESSTFLRPDRIWERQSGVGGEDQTSAEERRAESGDGGTWQEVRGGEVFSRGTRVETQGFLSLCAGQKAC